MEYLSGNLSDFALPDILQILALCQKTGVLSLEGSDYSGRIIVERGRIIYAATTLTESLASNLSREQAEVIQQSDHGAAAMRSPDVAWLAVRHFRSVIAALVKMEKGRFWLDVSQTMISLPENEFRLAEGLDIAEVLLDIARETDEAGREKPEPLVTHRAAEGDSLLTDDPLPSLGIISDAQTTSTELSYSELLYSCLGELKSLSFNAEVSLLVMRYASVIAGRGILFGVDETELRGLGQFGFKADPVSAIDDEVRSLRIPVSVDSILTRVVRTGKPYLGPMPPDGWRATLLERLGIEIRDCYGFFVPITCGTRTMFVVYGDDHSGNKEIRGAGELMILADQAGMMLDRLLLERLLRSR
jgi:hypothetical protein